MKTAEKVDIKFWTLWAPFFFAIFLRGRSQLSPVPRHLHTPALPPTPLWVASLLNLSCWVVFPTGNKEAIVLGLVAHVGPTENAKKSQRMAKIT